MMQRSFNILTIILVMAFPLVLMGQVQKVHYFLKYNDETCLFDFAIIIKEGQATTMQQRVQMNCQISIVVPTGSVVSMARKYNPLASNQTYGGTIPMDWQIGSTVLSPGVRPECDFYSIVPSLAPTSFYNNIYTNDTVRLFSLDISPIEDCGKGVRVFDNQNDPGPLEPGMNGSNFANGFTIGGIQNKYDGNANPHLPKAPIISNVTGSCSASLELHVEASAAMTRCQSYVTYEWTGPEEFMSSQPHVSIPGAGPLQKGMYYIRVQDSLGCTVFDSVQAYVKPDAGLDVKVRCYSSDVATLKAKSEGQWRFGQDNPGTAIFSTTENRLTKVYGFSDPGLYMAIWTSSGCSDTVWVDARTDCQCNIENTLDFPSVFSFCAIANEVSLSGNAVTEEGNYSWIHSVSGGNYVNVQGGQGQNVYLSNLGVGEHAFRRIFYKTSSPLCVDTSNVIFLEVCPGINAGTDVDLFCFSSDTARVLASGQGWWVVAEGNPMPLHITKYGNPVQQFQDFEVAGPYALIWRNDVCMDTLTIHANPYCGCHEADAGVDTIACSGDTIHLTGTCVAGIWRPLAGNPPGDTLVYDSLGISTIYFNPGSIGEFFYQFVVFDTLFDTVKVVVHALPVINAGEDFGFCEGSPPVLLVAGGGIQYFWSTEETASNILVAPTETTSYHVFGYNEFGCEGSDTITVSIMPKPQGNIPDLPIYYMGDTVFLEAGTWSHAQNFLWQGPGQFASNIANPMLPNITMEHSGSYTLTVTSENDCASTASVYLTVQNSLPVYLSSFQGKYLQESNAVVLEWKVDYMVNHDYFILERTTASGNKEIIRKIHTFGETGWYDFMDKDIEYGVTYIYHVISIDMDGTTQVFGPVEIKTGKDLQQLYHLYPNPFRDFVELKANIVFSENQEIRIMVYNATGQCVYQIVYKEHIPNNLLKDMPLLNFQSGMYRVLVIGNEVFEDIAFIKLD